jgi:hypothetical protein
MFAMYQANIVILAWKSIQPRGDSLLCKILVRSDLIEVWAGCTDDVLGEKLCTDVRLVSVFIIKSRLKQKSSSMRCLTAANEHSEAIKYGANNFPAVESEGTIVTCFEFRLMR